MKNILNSKPLAWMAFIVLMVLYVDTVVDYSINVPFSDDFHQQLSTASEFEKGHSQSYSLFRQHNVHRIFTTHIFVYLEHAIFGEVNLNHQLFVALFMLVALVLVIASFSREEHRPAVILISSLLILSPEACATWVGGTTPYYALILFSLISIKTLLLIDQHKYLAVSIVCMWLAAYSMVGGVILPIIGIIYLVFSGKIKSINGLLWAACSIGTVIWFFQGFVSHSNQPSIFFFVEDPEFTYEFTFRMLGNLFSDVIEVEFLSDATFFILVGFTYLVIAKTSVKKLYSSPESLAFVFILLVVGSVVAGRAGFQDPNLAYADRYFIYTKTLWLLALVFLLNNQLVSRDIRSFILGFCCLYIMATYQFEIGNLDAHKKRQSNAMLDHLVRGDSSGFEFGDAQLAGEIVDKAMTLGVYSPELRVTKSRQVKYLKYSDFRDGLDISVVRDKTVGRYRYFAFSVDADTAVHEIAIVPREVHGPATLLKPAAKIDPSRLSGVDLEHQNNDIYEIIIDVSEFDDSLTNDVFVISLGMITTMGTL